MHRTLQLTFVSDCLQSMLNTAKVGDKLRVASDLNLPWYGSIKWNIEENFRMEWNMEWKISSIYIWNGRKLPVWNIEKSSSIPYHALTLGFGWD